MRGHLTDTERAIIQVLFAYGVVEDSRLKDYIKRISKDLNEEIKFKETATTTSSSSSSSSIHPKLLELFKNINSSMDPYAFQIKTVCYNDQIVQEDGSKLNNFVFHHGIVNIDEDVYAKKFGTVLDEKSTKFFTKIAIRLVESKILSTTDIYGLKTDTKMTNTQIDDFLFTLQEQKWLARDPDTAYWKLGFRTYLELKSYLMDATENPGLQTLQVNTVLTHGTNG